MEDFTGLSEFQEDLLYFWEKHGLTKLDLSQLSSDNEEIAIQHLRKLFDQRTDMDEMDWFNLAYEIQSAVPHIAILLLEELCRRGCPYEGNVASLYFDMGPDVEEYLDKAIEWYMKGMARWVDKDESMYFAHAEGYIDCECAARRPENIYRFMLGLLDLDPKNGTVWRMLSELFNNKYDCGYVQPCIWLACLIQANKYECSRFDKSIIDDMKRKQPAVYEKAINLDIYTTVRQSLQLMIENKPLNDMNTVLSDTFILAVGDKLAQTTCCERLSNMGYDKVAMVYMPGQYAHRGGIIDIFPYQSSEPYRIDWFDDSIETIRAFDSKTMLTAAKHDKVVIPIKLQPAELQQKQPPKAKNKSRKCIPHERQEVVLSGRYYRIIIYVLACLVVFLCYKLYTQN